jgi:hypothetical protein
VDKPTVFISHRHADATLARVVADFLDGTCAGNVQVHLSSSADFEHPQAGEQLVPELKRQLARSDVVVLVFTTDGPGWSWCMWECGVATDPRDEVMTKVVVLQCGDSAPGPYVDQIRVNALDLESVTGFVKRLLTTTDLFPSQSKPLCGYGEAHPKLRQLAAGLHADLRQAITELEAPDPEERWASTYLCIELDADAVAGLQGAPPEEAARLIAEQGRIVDKQGANALFGRRVCRGELVGQLQVGIPTLPGRARWFDSLVEQIRATVVGLFPMVPWAPISVEPGKAVIPYVAGVRTVPATGAVHVLVYFVPMSPRPVPVVERMIEPDQMFYKDLVATPGEEILLVDLIDQMDEDRLTRVPMVGEEGRPKFIVHQSMIDEFVCRQVVHGGRDARTLTVADLLNDPCRADTYRTTLAIVGPDADMDTALAAMNAVPGCQDVFVTADGTADTAVIGWLTNTMFTR